MLKTLLASCSLLALSACGGGSETAPPIDGIDAIMGAQQDNQPIYINGKLWPKGTPIPRLHQEANPQPTAETIAMWAAQVEARKAADPVAFAREQAAQKASLKRTAFLGPYTVDWQTYPSIQAAAAAGARGAQARIDEVVAADAQAQAALALALTK